MQTQTNGHAKTKIGARGARNGNGTSQPGRTPRESVRTREAPEWTPPPEAPHAKAKGGKKTIELPDIEIEELPLRLVGLSPLIVHAWSKKAITQMRDKQQKLATGPKAAKDPEADFEGAKYLDPKTKKDSIRAHFIKNAIVSACRFADDMKMTVLRGAMFVEGDYLPLKFSECRMREDTVRVGQGTADLRYRPEYLDWSCDIVVSYNANVLSAEQVANLVRLAGFSVGLCEWRPERNGIFGRFGVEALKTKPRKVS
jgi:hypothetical protein